MRVILIGASGLLGSSFVSVAPELDVDIKKVSRGNADESFLYCDLHQLDTISATLMQIDDVNSSDVVLINSGVLGPVGLGAEVELGELVRTININALSNVPVFEALQAKGVRKYIVVSSGAANRFYSGWFAYCLSKTLQKSIWTAFCHDHPEISVKLCAPGVLASSMHDFTNFIERDRYPDLEKFFQIKDKGEYQNAEVSARKILEMSTRDSFFSAGLEFIDLRTI